MKRLKAYSTMTFVHVVGLVLSLPAAAAFSRGVGDVGWFTSGSSAALSPWVEAMLELRERDATLLASVTLLGVSATLLLSPWLNLAWLSSALDGAALSVCLRRARRGYARAVAVSALLFPLFVLGAALVFAVPYFVDAYALGFEIDPAADACRAAALLPGTVILAVWGVAHDLARAAVAAGATTVLEAVRRAVKALRPGLLLRYLAAVVLAGSFAGAAVIVAAALELRAVPSWPRVVWSFIAGQVFALAATLCRHLWLVHATRRIASAPSLPLTP